MDELRISELPHLERAVLIGAFSGWNDAASAASWAVKFLVNQWDAQPFADVDPEGFYDFTETRPEVRIASGAVRRFSWPGMRFYFARAAADETARPRARPARDVVLLLGEEPQLRWKAFGRAVAALCHRCDIADVAMLGALVAEVPHTLPVPVSGVSTQAATLRRLRRSGVELATYEGPTGILSALQEVLRKEGMGTTSLWGAAPYYVSATPNLPVSEALLRKLDEVYEFQLRLRELARAARQFNERVTTLVERDAEVAAYVQELERRAADEGGVDSAPRRLRRPRSDGRPQLGGELPSADQVIEDVEAWLREFRGQPGAE